MGDTLAPLAVNADAPAGIGVLSSSGQRRQRHRISAGGRYAYDGHRRQFWHQKDRRRPQRGGVRCPMRQLMAWKSACRYRTGGAPELIRRRSDAAALRWWRLDRAGRAWDLGDRVCAGGVAGEVAYAATYALRPGMAVDLAAAVGADPGMVVLSWTPPPAGASQVAVAVNVVDDTDCCLDALPGLDASEYTCAGRREGATCVALLHSATARWRLHPGEHR